MILYEALGILPAPESLGNFDMPVIEDLSQSLGASRMGKISGSYGTFAIYALEQESLVTAGGGSLLFTKDKKAVPILRGIADTTPEELALTDFNAALGLAQLKDLPSSLERRSELESRCASQVARTRHSVLSQPEEGVLGRIAFPVILESGMREVIIHAKKNGVEASPAFERAVVSNPEFPAGICPSAKSLALRCVLFPLHDRISSAEARTMEKVLATLP